MNYLFFILMYLFLIPTIYFEHLSSSLYPIFKFITSLSFLLCGYYGYKTSAFNSKSSTYLLIGLFFGVLGDILLTLTITNSFILGAIAFAIGHLFFIKSFIYLSPLSLKDLTFIFISFMLFTLLIFKLKTFNFNNFRPIVLIYGLIILIMLITAINQYKFIGLNKTRCYLIILGASLFTISDFILLFTKFCPTCPEIFNSLNLLTYYTGQALISLSLTSKYSLA